MPNVTDKQVREAIAAIIRAACPKSVVFPRQVLPYSEGGWAAFLRSPNDGNRINAWVITRVERLKSPGDRNYDLAWKYVVFHYLQFSQGTDTANSEDDKDAYYEAASDALSDSPQLGFAPQFVLGHDELNFSERLEISGGTACHVGEGTLTVNFIAFRN